MTEFILAWLYELNGDASTSSEILDKTNIASYDYLFPSRTYEQIVLEWALQKDETNTKAAFGLGNYYFNLKRHEDAINVWERAAEASCSY